MDPALWLAFALASAALVIVPGPTVLLVLALGLGAGRRVAVPAALGVAAGDLMAMTASLLGLGAVIATSAAAFTAVKWAGAAYLVWLGYRMIRGAGRATPAADRGAGSAFRSAFWVTALNPKSIAFFLAFVPQFVDPGRPYLPQAAILVATFVVLGSANALAYAILAGRLGGTVRRPRTQAWLARAGGATLIGMGLVTAGLRRAA